MIVPAPRGAALTRLDRSSAPELQALFERCAGFFTLTEGSPPHRDAAARELETVAPGRTADETFCFGAWRDESLAAFLHLTENHPRPREWWLGLLLVDPALRRA